MAAGMFPALGSGLAALAVLAVAATASASPGSAPVAIAVELGGSAELAGIEAGDRLIGWNAVGDRGPLARGRFEHPEVVELVEREFGERRAVDLEIKRQGRRIALRLAPGGWQLSTSPDLPAAGATRVVVAEARAANGDIKEAAAELEALACHHSDDPLVSSATLAAAARLGGRDATTRARRALDAGRSLAPLTRLALAARLVETLDPARDRLALATQAEAAILECDSIAAGSTTCGGLRLAVGFLHALGPDQLRAAELLAAGVAILDRNQPESESTARAHHLLGMTLATLGQIGQGEAHYRRGLEIRLRRDPTAFVTGISYQGLAVVASLRGDDSAASAWTERAVAVMRRLRRDELNDAVCDLLLAQNELLLDRSEAASARLWRALPIFAQPDHARLLGMTLEILARSEQLAGRSAAAAELALRAVELWAVSPQPESELESRSLAVLSSALVDSGRWSEAVDARARSVAIRRRISPDSALLANSLAELSTLQRRLGRAEDAQASACEAIEVAERALAAIGGVAAERIGFRADLANVYVAGVRALLDAGRPMDAFQLLESARAAELRTMLTGRRIEFALRPELAATRDRFDRRIRALRASLAATDDDEAARQQLGELDLARAERARIVEQTERPDRIADLDVDRLVHRALAPGDLLVSWLLAEEGGFAFVLDARGELRHVPIAAGIDEIAERVASWRARLQSHSPPAAIRAAAERVSDLVLAPLAPLLTGTSRLFLIPDGPLHLVPFASLIDPESGDDLIAKRTLVVAPSAQSLLERSQQQPRSPTLVAFADPTVGGPRVASTRDEDRPLPGARAEIAEIAKVFSGSVDSFVGEQASEGAFRANAARATHLHLAVHASVLPEQPLDNALLLAGSGDEAAGDGRLEVWEIFEQIHLDADLVVLSACNTAIGKDAGGEGVVGLARAFEWAGARNVISTLWPIDDTASAALMTAFYRQMAGGRPYAEALRLAQLELRATAPDSRLWAGFRLTASGATPAR